MLIPVFSLLNVDKLGFHQTCTSIYCISGVRISMLTSSVVYSGFEPRSGQTTDYKTGICRFSAKHAALRRKSKDWLTRNQDNMSEWGNMSIRGLFFQWASTIKIQLSILGLVQKGPHHYLIENSLVLTMI
jgi:hypothetical protein